MTQLLTIEVPDIGDFKDVEIIELLAHEGDAITVEQALLTLESDKASIEVPSPHAGQLQRWLVGVGDKVSQGTPLAVLELADNASTPSTSTPAEPEPARTDNTAATASAQFDLVVLGAGPGGYSAAFRAADLGLNVALIERYPTLGGVCLNVGCIPSKALLHVTNVMDEAQHLAALGIDFGPAKVELSKLLEHKSNVVSKLTNGLAGMAKMRKVTVLRGIGQFLDAHQIELNATEGTGKDSADNKTVVSFKRAIIAAGSQAVKLPFLPDDPRIVDSTGALELPFQPKRMLVIGGGIIGMEMATVYSSLGARVDVVEMLDGLMAGADKDLVKVWQKINAHRFDNLMLNTKTVSAKAEEDAIYVRFEGDAAPAEPQAYDLVLVAVGRRPNGDKLNAQAAGVQVDERGFIAVDSKMQSNVANIAAIGDIVGQPMLAHKAVHEAHVAAEVAAGVLNGDKALASTEFDPMQIPSVAYTDPEIAWAGLTEEQAKKQGVKFKKGLFPWAASGRAIANGRDEGFTKLLFDAQTQRIIGGGIVGTNAGDLISEVCLAIEMGADMVDIGKTIHPHPTLGESVGMAAEVAHGTCTDLPPQRR